ncbi:MAG: 1-acyl-sn-glycerol-3-phosphate acyltransferase [Clostridiales bacterium]|nr:1-acyl-sn-glycerol-3-phosphate acyltransferase [Clostridiales bacterium]
MNFYEKAHKYLAKLIIKMFRITVVGGENEPSDGGYIACANHISFFDVIVMAVAMQRQIRYMAKKELFGIPIIGKLITSLGAFPVDRKGNSAGSIRNSIKLLQSGEVVGMYPTGHRFAGVDVETTRDAVKGGAGMAAYHAKVPVLPMYIKTKNSKTRLFRPITIYVGKPISYDEFGFTKGGSAEYQQASMLIFDRIVELKQSHG